MYTRSSHICLFSGLYHSNAIIVSACIRTMRTLYCSGLAPPSPLFDDATIAKQLVSMLSKSSILSQSAAIIISKACQVILFFSVCL